MKYFLKTSLIPFCKVCILCLWRKGDLKFILTLAIFSKNTLTAPKSFPKMETVIH